MQVNLSQLLRNYGFPRVRVESQLSNCGLVYHMDQVKVGFCLAILGIVEYVEDRLVTIHDSLRCIDACVCWVRECPVEHTAARIIYGPEISFNG